MRILMLGNSFTYYNDMPRILAAMLGEEVVSFTRGGAYLSAHLDPADEMYEPTHKALSDEKWDYVILQEQSNAPMTKRDAFQQSAKELCDLIRQNGAKPLFYATWAYKDGTEKLAGMGRSYDEMIEALYDSYHAAAEANDALIADVGLAFRDVREIVELYCEDAFHPSPAGSVLAAATIAAVIRKDAQ